MASCLCLKAKVNIAFLPAGHPEEQVKNYTAWSVLFLSPIKDIFLCESRFSLQLDSSACQKEEDQLLFPVMFLCKCVEPRTIRSKPYYIPMPYLRNPVIEL